MTLHEFRDVLKKMWFINRQPWMGTREWQECRDDPVKYLLNATEFEAEKIWDLIKPEERT